MAFVLIKHKKKGKGVLGIKSIRGAPTSVKVGLPAGKADQAVIERATYNEFGTQHIPERPAMRNAIRDNKASYRAAMIAGAKSIFRAAALGESPNSAALQVLRKLGAKAQGDIQEEITALHSPPNAASTIKQKGSSNPLIDSGEYRRAITWKIQD